MPFATIVSAAQSYDSIYGFVTGGDLYRSLTVLGDNELKAAQLALESSKLAVNPKAQVLLAIGHLQSAYVSYRENYESLNTFVGRHTSLLMSGGLIRALCFGNLIALTDNKGMPEYKYTAYFENEVLRKRPYIKREWCIKVIENPIRVEVQGETRVRFWGEVAEFDNRIFRVVTLADRVTIHNAFPDSGFKL